MAKDMYGMYFFIFASCNHNNSDSVYRIWDKALSSSDTSTVYNLVFCIWNYMSLVNATRTDLFANCICPLNCELTQLTLQVLFNHILFA